MKVFSVHQAKAQLSKLLALVEGGEEVVIARNTHPVVRLVKFEDHTRRRRFFQDEGKQWIGENFNEPLPPEVLDSFFK
ncbi:MAG: type II toxin-antitoxin system prevent-host-death family antitoxin [Candidatus Sericytochromatia bacterium]|nr:type II toxin-antitoxin system prevent-host-death family antitoxin [Candidatus Tanganyikabacteria bacterium]